MHDLHIWGMSTTDVALTAHLIRPCHGGEDALLASATRLLRDRFGIAHATLQVEQGLAIHPCDLAALRIDLRRLQTDRRDELSARQAQPLGRAPHPLGERASRS